MFAQQHKLSGYVTDEKGKPAMGIHVTVQHQNQASVTDYEGIYSLELHEGDYKLEFAGMGQKPKYLK